jgi:alkylation response protein AidB-like acyl-CoA dehydrogenase
MTDPFRPIGLTEEHVFFRNVVRDFVNERVVPTASAREAKAEYPADLIPQLAELGLMGMSVSEEYGGSAVDYVTYGLVFEELARGWMGLASVVGSSASGAYLIDQFGTPEQKDRFLPELAQGRRMSGIAMTEPSVGTDLKALRLTARKEGNHYVLNGSKTMITQARHADPLVVLVKTSDDAEKPHRGMSLMLVEQDTPGYCVGRDLGKLGQRGVDLCELNFIDAQVPVSNLLGGEEGQGFYQMMSALDRGRIYIASASVGIARASLEAATKYAQERDVFGRPIAEFQAVQMRLADMAMKIDAARFLYINAAAKTEAEGRATAESSMAKVYASEIAVEAAYEAMRIHGGYGYTTEFPVERYLRDAALNPIGEGTNDMLRGIIARALVG